MMPRSIPILTGCLIGAGALAMLWHTLTPKRPVRAQREQPVAVNETAPSAQPLWHIVSETPREAEVVPPQPAPSTAARTEQTEEPPKLSDNLDDYRDYLGTVFDRDSRDRTWEQAAEVKLRGGLAKVESPELSVRAVECRASMCKVLFAASDDTALRKAKSELPRRAFFWEGPGIITDETPSGTDQHRIVAYFGREGRELPDG
jgi:hypothetical protein